jgi:hypothetical protein
MGWPDDQEAPVFDPNQPHILGQNPPPNVNWENLANQFGASQNKLLIKRDVTTSNHPCGEDLDIGELVFNAITGNLYSKTLGGDIIMYAPTVICSDSSSPSLGLYKFSLSIPENCADICTNSAYGITLTSAKKNAIRFNPVPIVEGLPISYNIFIEQRRKATAPPFEEVVTKTHIARISLISDYKSTMSFEFVYYIDDTTFYPLDGLLGPGSYDNGQLGKLIIETL